MVSPPEDRPSGSAPPDRGCTLGGAVTIAELEDDPHPLLAMLRAREPVSWLPVLGREGGWLITRRDLAVAAMRDAETFTVDDPRFSTAQVVGPSMLSLDGPEHTRHRTPFADRFRPREVEARLAGFIEGEAARLVSALRPSGAAELRRGLAGPLAVAVVAESLGLLGTDPATVLGWYDAIVGAVSDLSAGLEARPQGVQAVQRLAQSVHATVRAGEPGSLLVAAAAGGAPADAGVPGGIRSSGIRSSGIRSGDARSGDTLGGDGAAGASPPPGAGLELAEIVSNAAVMMFGGIETTEAMIANAALHLLSRPDQLALVRAEPELLADAIEESLRLEPAAAVVDRYATRDVELAGARVRAGDLVSISIAAANRDPETFPDPDRFEVRRPNARLNLAFAQGPHFCLGAHAARLETRAALSALLRELPSLRLDPQRPAAAPRGLVFRKPDSVYVRWDT